MNLTKEEIDVIFNASQTNLELASFAKRNPNVVLPKTEEQFNDEANKLMDIIRNNHS